MHLRSSATLLHVCALLCAQALFCLLSFTGSAAWGQTSAPTVVPEDVRLYAPTPRAGDYFGGALATDDSQVLIGATGPGATFVFDSDFASRQGTVFVFPSERSDAPAAPQMLRPSGVDSEDVFGSAVAVEKGHAIVGAIGTEGPKGEVSRAGAAYAFKRRPDGTWEHMQTIRPPSIDPDGEFGHRIAMDGRKAVITTGTSPGTAYVFERSEDSTWEKTGALRASNGSAEGEYGGDNFGDAVALGGDYIVVGAHREDGPSDRVLNAGAAYVFERQEKEGWEESQILRAHNADAQDYFGTSVALEGEHLLVGADGEDGPTDNKTESGAVYVFQFGSGGGWKPHKLLRLSDTSRTNVGSSLAIDQGRAVVGAFYADGPEEGMKRTGIAYVLRRTRTGHWQKEGLLHASNAVKDAKLHEDHTAFHPYFGNTVALSDSLIVVGANGSDVGPTGPAEDVGAVYLYRYREN